MLDLTDLKQAGHSRTSRAWLTNPSRHAALSVLRPYFLRLASSINELENTTARQSHVDHLRDRIDAIEQRLTDAAEREKSAKVLKEELLGFNRMLDGLHKDQTALNHRLGSLEDEVETGQQMTAELGGQIRALAEALSAFRQEQQALYPQLQDLSEGVSAARGIGQRAIDDLRALSGALEGFRSREMAAVNETDWAARDKILQSRQMVTDLQQRMIAMETEMRRSRSAIHESMSVLSQAHPVALLGTSLLLHTGPYGHFLLRQPDLISDHIIAGSFWDSHLKPIIERTGRSDRNAIDAGAYLGFHSVYMSRYFRAVHSFEPQIEIYRMLCANLLLNGCDNVVAVHAGLYDEPGYMCLADDADQEIPIPRQDGALDYSKIGNAAALTFRPATEGESSSVQTLVIDQLGLEDVALIKVDTQGSDLHVLRGARNTIEKCRPCIVVEYERELALRHRNTFEDYGKFFEEIGYAVEVLSNKGEGKQVDLLATPK